MLVQEKGRLKKMKDHSLHLTFHSSKKNKKDRTSLKVHEGKIHKEKTCFFYKKVGHFKKDCLKRKKWFEKKGTYYVSIGFESNLIEEPNNTWWLDSGATTHASHLLQGFLSIQPVRKTEKFLYMRNKMKARIEGIGTYRLILDSGCCLNLEKCLCFCMC